MQRYSVAVAAFDFLPVGICALGLGLLARGISRQNQDLVAWAWTAAALIAAGGLCKATWKLLVAWRGLDLPVLENLLFIAMAPGFVMMSFCSGLRWSPVLFSYNFIAVLGLSGLSRLPAGEATAWLQEAVNLSAQSEFALGAWQLYRCLETRRTQTFAEGNS